MSRALFEHATLTSGLLTADAVVVLTGDGVTRLPTALELFRRGGAPVLVVSGGVKNPPYSLPAYHLVGLLLEKGVDPERMKCEDESQHTRDSAESVVAMCEANEWGRILLVTSPYHLPRALLTFVAVLRERDLHERIHVVPVAAHQPQFEAVDGLDVARRLDLVESEAAKVAEYQGKGDVASYEDGLAYLAYWEGR